MPSLCVRHQALDPWCSMCAGSVHPDATRVCRHCEGEFRPRESDADASEFWCSKDCEWEDADEDYGDD